MLRYATGLLLTGSVLALLALLLPEQTATPCTGTAAAACHDAAKADAGVEIENPLKKLAMYDSRAKSLTPPPGAMRAAIEAKRAITPAKAEVRGASGRWQQYGRGPLIGGRLLILLGDQPGPNFETMRYSGRVDDFAYDPEGKRLFAAVSTGGIWMSRALGDDITTLGDQWVPVGDNLPYQANGGVIWLPGGGGTLIAAGGDSVMSTGAFHGIGAFWTNDLGLTWHRSEGYPDDALVFNTDADPSNPNIAYIASSMGLFRTEDAGRTFQNVALPTTPFCAGNEDRASVCNLANVVSGVVVQHPGGTTGVECSANGCPVLAAVGWRAGALNYPDTEIPQAPANGLYKSQTGEPNTFVRLDPPPVDSLTAAGFAPQERIGRVEMGQAIGPGQDHGFVYALVQDAQFLNKNGGDERLDLGLGGLLLSGPGMLHGLYVSPDFGETWTQLADSIEIGTIPGPWSALIAPGSQSWYDQWVQPDPTLAVPGTGVPTRLMFGLEELFQSTGAPMDGSVDLVAGDFENIGYYSSVTGLDTSPHPDQHANIFVTDALGRVCLFAGNDGGVSKQCALPGGTFHYAGWGEGANDGLYTMLPYGFGVAKDGTVWFGLQDNGSGHMEPATGESFQDYGGDGFFAEVNADNSDIGFAEYVEGDIRRTTDRGDNWTDIGPPLTRPNFSNWFSMDPLDSEHMIIVANEVYETTSASTVTGAGWVQVYSFGVNPATRAVYTSTVADVHGAAIYAGACGDCGVTNNDEPFRNKLATNVGGKSAPKPETGNGWHAASAKGLPNRLITSIEIDPNDPFTVYVGLGEYMSGLRAPYTFGEDPNHDADREAGYLFKSVDAGETFVSIQGDLPRMPVTSLLARDGQLLAATDIGVFIAADEDGSAWAPLGDGLPAAPVTMIKLQPGNPNKLFASLFGRHIWTYEFPADAAVTVDSGARSEGLASIKGGGLDIPLLLIAAGGLLGLRRRRRAAPAE